MEIKYPRPIIAFQAQPRNESLIRKEEREKERRV